MIYTLALGVADLLAAKGFPYPVIYGPERLERGAYDPVIVVERDRAAGDSFEPAHGVKENPRRLATRMVGARAVIRAKSSLPNANVWDHEDECDQIVDGFYCALRAWISANLKWPSFTLTESRYLRPEELNGEETWPGVAYVMRWRVPRGVYDANFEGAGLPTGEVGGNTVGPVRLYRNGTDPPEIVELP